MLNKFHMNAIQFMLIPIVFCSLSLTFCVCLFTQYCNCMPWNNRKKFADSFDREKKNRELYQINQCGKFISKPFHSESLVCNHVRTTRASSYTGIAIDQFICSSIFPIKVADSRKHVNKSTNVHFTVFFRECGYNHSLMPSLEKCIEK